MFWRHDDNDGTNTMELTPLVRPQKDNAIDDAANGNSDGYLVLTKTNNKNTIQNIATFRQEGGENGTAVVVAPLERQKHFHNCRDGADKNVDKEPNDPEKEEDVTTMHPCQSMHAIGRARRLLYASHVLSQWNDVAWQFCLVLVLAFVTQYQSLLLVSTYGMCLGLGVTACSGRIGRWMDRRRKNRYNHNQHCRREETQQPHRLSTLQFLIGMEGVAVVAVTISCVFLLSATATTFDNDLNQTALVDPLPLSVDGMQNDNDNDDDDNEDRRHYLFHNGPNDTLSIVLLSAIHAFGTVAHVLDQAVLVALERDWVVVISQSAAAAASRVASQKQTATPTTSSSPSFQRTSTTTVTTPSSAAATANVDEGDGDTATPSNANVETETLIFHQWLSNLNVAMKQIDLSCKVVAPVVVGFIVSVWTNRSTDIFTGYQWICLGMGCSNATALVVEYVCTVQIFALVPALQNESVDDPEGQDPPHLYADPNTQSCTTREPLPEATRCGGDRGNSNVGISLYMQQSCAWSGLALAVLYMNTLTFGNGIMTTYLLHHNLSLAVIGLLRGIAAAIGLLGTVAYHVSMQYLSLDITALWSILYQALCLGLSMVSLLMSRDVMAVSFLISGICLSRIGLWVFDIAITQKQQQEIPANIRTEVGGVQQSLNAFFNLLGFAIGIAFPKPESFPVYISVSFLSVFTATLLFVSGVYSIQR